MEQPIKKIKKDANGIIGDKPIYTLLLDMNSIMKMSLKDARVNTDGVSYGMIYQTLLQIKIMLKKKDFDFVYAMYDGYNSGVLKYKYLNEYKKNRGKQYSDSDYYKKMDEFCQKVLSKAGKQAIKYKREKEEERFFREREILVQMIEEICIRQIIVDDVEGDDLIAYYVNNKMPNEKIIIVSGDRDLTQLLAKDVAIYATQLKDFITVDNHTKVMGYDYRNVVLKKILCGDASDNIHGIKGFGEKTLYTNFPEIKEREMSIKEIVDRAKQINEERISSKKKPLQWAENIINQKSDGEQDGNVFEINEKIINLRKPLISNEGILTLQSFMYSPLDVTDRTLENLYKIIVDNKLEDLMDENKFSSFFVDFERIRKKEKLFFEKNSKES